MSRFEGLSPSIYEMRQVLRDRLGRMLRPAHENVGTERSDHFDLSDVDMLDILLRIRIVRGDDVATVQATYEAHRTTNPDSPTWESLLEEGWFGVAWDCVTTELHTHMAARRQDQPLRSALAVILDRRRHDIRFKLDDISTLSSDGQRVAKRLLEHHEKFRALSAPSPDWVVARLWERRPEGDDRAALRWWVDRWRLLGKPVGPPTLWWSKADARAWRDAAFTVLQTDPGLVGWEHEKAIIDARLRNEGGRVPTPAMPSGLIERWGWLNGPHLDQWARGFELCGDTWVLVDLLCEDLLANDRVPHTPSAEELLNLVVTRPTLLVLLASRIQQHPALLADVLLHPTTSAWGCLMVADRSARPIGAWERALQESEGEEARERAFADATAIATQHLRVGKGAITEMADLLVWLHDRARADVHAMPGRPRKVSDRMLAVVHSELQSLSKPLLDQLLEALSFRETDGLGTPRFTAALDLVAFGALTDSVDADRAVAAYVAALRPDGEPYFSVGLTPLQASALAVAAQRSPAWNTFLAPVNVSEELSKASRAENQYIARDKIARALRAHIRVLSRAIVAWEGAVPDDLSGALASAIRAGSSSHEEKARVAAFAAKFETVLRASRAEPPLVVDVAEAYTRLPDASRSGINDALLLIDEPLALALLLPRVVGAFREKLAARIDSLTPDDAASIDSLTEMQGRIEELLNAGALQAASMHMGVERGLKTFGRVQGRAVTRLRWELRLALQRGEFDRIAQATPPPELDPRESESAQDSIDFYKAVAELSKLNGNALTAESLFASLAHRHPGNAAYVVNLFAARLSRMLNGDLFHRLGGADIPAARAAMKEADDALQRVPGVEQDDTRIHRANRALLLLAIGRNDEAYNALQQDRRSGEQDQVAAYSAVALARMGRMDEASASLEAGDAAHPGSAVLKAAREHLKIGAPARLTVPSVSTDDPVAAIQGALYRLTQLDPSMQARVASRQTTEAHLAEEVRSAAAGVTALVPHLREAQLQEDDVTAVLLRILEPRARLFGWSVPDQSKGGYSAQGNPGERDLVLRKDGYVISVIEAVVCKHNPATKSQRRNLTSHFQKLFGYDKCRVLFHIVYSYIETPSEIVKTMRGVAQSDSPSEFTFVRTDDLSNEDSRPAGFVATYTARDGGDVKVVCLVMDMRQQGQRDAASLAGRTRAPLRAQAESQ